MQRSSGPQSDAAAERDLLALCMQGGNRAVDTTLESGASADDLGIDSLRVTFGSMVRLVDEGKDVNALLVVDDLTQHGELDAAGGAAAVSALAIADTHGARIEDVARMVVEHAAFRRTLDAAQVIRTAAVTRAMPAVELISLAQTTFLDLNSHVTNGVEVVDRARIVQDVLASAGKKAPGAIPTGFPELDEWLGGGLLPGTMTLVAGRPGQGKTALGLAMASYQTDEGLPVGFFELEMPAASLIAREISAKSGIAKRDWDITRDNRARVAAAAAHVNDRPLFIVDRPGLTAAEICAAARRMKARHGIAALYVDHIGKVKASDRYAGDRNNETGETSEALRALAGTLDIPVVALCQLNRGVETRADKRPGLADLRDSGTLEQDAHAVIFPFRPEYYAKEKTPASQVGLCELDLAKNRDGQVGVARVRFDAPTQRFYPRFEEA